MSRTDARMTDDERAKVVRLLEQTRDDFLAAVDSVTDAQWDFRPSADSWSIGSIAEHLGLVERRLFGQVERALGTPANQDWASGVGDKDGLVTTMLGDRGARRDAPAASVPSGTVGRAEALRIFGERRAVSLSFAQTTGRPLRAHTLDHHRALVGALDAYQWLLYIPLHHQRHLAQIADIKASPGYPAA